MNLTVKILIGVLVATIITLVTLRIIDPTIAPQISTTNTDKNSESEDVFKVEISGEINNAGIYYVDINYTLDELITDAGGLTNNADLLAFESTLSLEDNASYYIAPLYEINDICGNTKITKYNINNCSAEDLQKIDGIGETISKSIVSYRQEIGKFRQIEDVMKVSGIGNSTFSKLKNFIRIKDA